MLKDFEKTKPEEKEALNAEIKELRARLIVQQQLLREAKLPVLVLLEGWAAAGKGSLVKEIISEIDPRFYNVVSPVVIPESEARYPFLYPYAAAIPENGKLIFLDSGWMEDTVRKILRLEITKEEYKRRVRSVNEFERQLRDGGYLLLKIFLHIDEEEQYERLRTLSENAETEWRVTPDDLWQHKEYKKFLKAYDDFMEDTNDTIHWHILDGKRKKAAVRDAMKLLVNKIDKALEHGRYVGEPFEYDGAGIFPPGLTNTANIYLRTQKTNYVAYNTMGVPFEDLLKLIENKCPVVLWTTLDYEYPILADTAYEYKDKFYYWYELEHCVFLCGYDLDGHRHHQRPDGGHCDARFGADERNV